MNSPETAGRDIIPFRNAKKSKKSKKGGTQQVPEDSNISLEIYRKRISAMKELFLAELITINPDQNWRAPEQNKRIQFGDIEWELVAENNKVEYFVPLRNLLHQEKPNKIKSEYYISQKDLEPPEQWLREIHCSNPEPKIVKQTVRILVRYISIALIWVTLGASLDKDERTVQ